MFMSTIVIVRKELINQVRHNITKFNLRMVRVYVMCLRNSLASCYCCDNIDFVKNTAKLRVVHIH